MNVLLEYDNWHSYKLYRYSVFPIGFLLRTRRDCISSISVCCKYSSPSVEGLFSSVYKEMMVLRFRWSFMRGTNFKTIVVYLDLVLNMRKSFLIFTNHY